MRCFSAGSIFLRSTKSSEKSISSTVHVFLMASLYISKNCGYFIGRRVRLNPGSRIFSGLLDTGRGDASTVFVVSDSGMIGTALSSVRAKSLSFLIYSQASQCSGFSREQASASASLNPCASPSGGVSGFVLTVV